MQQDYPQDCIEIIVIDDGSTDNTKTLLLNYINNNSIKYIYQDNEGKAKATQVAINYSAGEYIFNLDADDYYLSNKISTSVSIFKQSPSIVHVSSPALICFEDTKKTTTENLPLNILNKETNGNKLLHYFYTNNILYGGGSTFSAKASVLKKISIPTGVDMYIDEFLLLATLPFGNSYFVEKPLSSWCVHGNNYSSAVSIDKISIKNNRLLNSSIAVLSYLYTHSNDTFLIKMYCLQHANRKIHFKELIKNKDISDILSFSHTIFVKHFYSPLILFRYKAFNRLIPQVVLSFLKKN